MLRLHERLAVQRPGVESWSSFGGKTGSEALHVVYYGAVQL
ncbi:MAG: hypothetical protein KatS3mg060_1906 [Dehalococcoidia bacterium]|nr:MAG: hypothetical protein KatS3mg060_1906 [Dehalococcoidia bacterium]